MSDTVTKYYELIENLNCRVGKSYPVDIIDKSINTGIDEVI